MIKTFTQTDLIRYLYQESTEEEAKEIYKALIRDSELQQLLTELRQTLKMVEDATLEPAPSTVLNILAYSKNWKPEA